MSRRSGQSTSSLFQVLTLTAGVATAFSTAKAQTPLIQMPVEAMEPMAVTVEVETSKVMRKFDPRRLGGTNVALWNDKTHFSSTLLRQWIADLSPGYIRIPGGSWTNSVYWNGNGVRDAAGHVDVTKVGPDGYPAVDYSDYKPGFSVDSDTLKPSSGYHGNVDVKTLHDFIRAIPGTEAMPCLNAGTGRPIDAAEWVKWANQKMGYNARVWEIGNELGGSWEPGNFLPGTRTPITAEQYTARYNGIASAMTAVDPTVQIGGCAFVKEMIRDGGTNVDFASIHTYPGSTAQSAQENLANLPKTIAKEVNQVRAWINEFQPTRADKIELAYTEWNLSGGLNASDLFSGLWHSTALAEMANNGVDFATQWDVYTHTKGMASGHGLIWSDGDHFVRKASYYAMMLWNNFTGNQLLSSTSSSPDAVYTFASKTDDAVYVMLINTNDDREANVTLNLNGFDAAAQGEMISLSSRNYFWDTLTSTPQWSVPPTANVIATAAKFGVKLPPFSVTHVRVPSAGRPELSKFAKAAPAAVASDQKPELRVWSRDSVYAGDKVQGYVQVLSAGTNEPYPGTLDPAVLSADREVTIDRPAARLAESLGRFAFVANEPGPLTLTATSGGVTTSKTIEVKPSVPRPMMIWDFGTPALSDTKVFTSEFDLVADATMRPNKDVARIELPGVTPSEKDRKRALLIVQKLPERASLDRSNIRGVFFDMQTRDIQSDDPNASISVVMQSPANYWMVLGRVPLKDKSKWERFQVDVTDAKFIPPMASAYNIWFVLSSSKPVSGTVFLDRIGLMVR